MNYLQSHYPRFDVDDQGNVYKDGNILKSFKSNNYRQVVLVDADGNQKVTGVHVVVAMKYLDYYEGCIVHHKDENKSNNNLDNLEVTDSTSHLKYHGQKMGPIYSRDMKGKTPWNKGMKMSEEFRKKCSESAKKRAAREQALGISRAGHSQFFDHPMTTETKKKLSESHKGMPFRGNQYVDENHNYRKI